MAITRETILRFSRPLEVGTVIDGAVFFAEFSGEKLAARIHLSPSRKEATLFYDEPLPPSAQIRVHFDGDAVFDDLRQWVDGDGDDAPGGEAVIEFSTLTVTTVPGTTVCGRVFDSEQRPNGMGQMINCPLAGVTITVDGQEETLSTITDAMGNFKLEPAPAGRFFVHIDGRTATNPIPAGAYFPFVGKAWDSVAGQESNVGDVFLPLIAENTLTQTSPTEEIVVTIPTAVAAGDPDLAMVELTVPADSLFSDDGTRGGMVGVAPVDPERLPGELPDDLNFPLVITVQTDGPTNFDQPVPICFPNLPDPDTGQFLAPGEKTGLWSFNHDTGRFEVVGPMTVSADGTLVCSDPGVGIRAPGWHGVAAGSPGGGGGGGSGPPPECKPGPDPCPPETCCVEPDNGPTDPVYLATGEFVEQETDMFIKGRGMHFEWTRRFSSREGRLTPMGHNWDFNYNISLESSGRIMKLNHGRSNSEALQKNEAGTFERRDLFLDVKEMPDESFEVNFPNKGSWTMHADDGSPQAGMIQEIRDRNGNTITLAYDAQGRLSTVTDTLNRDIAIAYNADGFVQSVTDFTGRQVTYEYYQDGDTGGGFGDLKSVTGPAVTGTPNGNDFPNGRRGPTPILLASRRRN